MKVFPIPQPLSAWQITQEGVSPSWVYTLLAQKVLLWQAPFMLIKGALPAKEGDWLLLDGEQIFSMPTEIFQRRYRPA